MTAEIEGFDTDYDWDLFLTYTQESLCAMSNIVDDIEVEEVYEKLEDLIILIETNIFPMNRFQFAYFINAIQKEYFLKIQ